MEESWEYEKLDENYNKMFCPMNDIDGKITGHSIIGLRQWFDENPEERKRLGWVKHIHHAAKDQLGDYDTTTHFPVCTTKQVDEFTIEDEWHLLPISEDMMVFTELANVMGLTISYGLLATDGNGGVMYRV